jgi:hypothetical protein
MQAKGAGSGVGSLPTLSEAIATAKGGKGSGKLPSLSAAMTPGPGHKPTPEHHGFLHNVVHGAEHVASQTVDDLYNTAVHSPKGLYETGKAVAQASMGNPEPLINIAKATGHGIVEDFRHPLRHPGNTLLDIGAAFSLGAGTAARVGEVGRVASAGESASAVARAALKGPKPEARVLEHDGVKINAGTYSRGAALRSTQKLFDRFHARFPEARPLPFGVRTMPERIAKEMATTHRFQELLGRAPAHELAKLGKGLSTPQQVALRVVAEGVPIADRIAFHENALAGGLKGRLATSTRRQVQLLKSAATYVHDVAGHDAENNPTVMPRIKPEYEDLTHIYQHAHGVAKQREAILQDTTKVVRSKGKAERVPALAEDVAAGRIGGPARVIHGATFVTRQEATSRIAQIDRGIASLERQADKLGNSAARSSDRRVKLTVPDNVQQKAALAAKSEAHLKDAHDLLTEAHAAREAGHITDADLAHIQDEAVRLQKRHDAILRATGQASKIKTAAQNEADRAARIAQAQKLVGQALDSAHNLREDVAGNAGRLAGAEHHFDPEMVPELFRVPYVKGTPKGALFKPSGWKGGNERAPASVRKSFSGALLTHGIFRNDTTKLVAESYLEAHRFAALVSHRDEFLQLAHRVPTSDNDVPIRLDALKDKPWPAAVSKIEDHSHLSPDEVEALGHAYDSLRQDLFPDKHEFVLDPEAHPDVMWIDKRLLGGINEPNPLVGFAGGAGRTAVKTADTINNASRLAILYLKPSYALPNLLGNAALTLVQQGWAAPKNLAIAARLDQRLGTEIASKIDTVVGEGMTAALHSHEGPLQKVTNSAANFWQKGVDTPFRRASFLHEARRFGYKTKADIERLFKDPEQLDRVTREANAALIDYGRMGRYERDIVRRIAFFYPWLKGSSVYAARFLGTHPQQAAVLGQLGRQGKAQDLKDLGAVPSYAEGIFKVGERGGLPMVINPNSAGILQTPAQLLQTARELTSNHPGSAFQFSQNFTPAVAAVLALLGRDGVNKNQSALAGAGSQLVGGLPAVNLVESLLHPPSESQHARVYPRDRLDAILKFLAGNAIVPTPYNPQAGHAAAYREQHPR